MKQRGLRQTAWVLVFCMLVSVIAGVTGMELVARAEVGVNLLTNPGFEDGDLTGWTMTGATDEYSIPGNAGQAKTGTYYLSTYKSTGHEVSAFQTLTGLPNGTYKASVWAVPGSLCYLSVSDHGGEEMKTTMGWRDSYGEYTIENIEVTTGTLTFTVFSKHAGGTGYRFDDCSLELVTLAAEPEPDPNLLANPGFEEAGLAGWTVVTDPASGVATRNGTNNNSGSYHLQNYYNGAYSSDVFQTVTGLEPGYYTASVYALRQGGTAKLTVSGYDEEDGTKDVAIPGWTSPDTAYKEYKIENIPVTSGELTFTLTCETSNQQINRFDEASLIRTGDIPPPPEPPEPPEGTTGDMLTPTGLSGFSPRGGQVDLVWNQLADTRLEGYNVYRDGTKIGEATWAACYTDHTAVKGTAYSYTVEGFHSGGSITSVAQSAPAVVTVYGQDGEAPREVGISPFAWDSFINTPIGSGVQFEDFQAIPVEGKDGYSTYALTQFWYSNKIGTGQWSNAVYAAKETDPVATLYTRDGGGVWQWSYLNANKAKGNANYSAEDEAELLATSHITPDVRDNSHVNKTTQSMPHVVKAQTAPVGIHSARVDFTANFFMPVGAVPSQDSDGGISIVQPNGFCVEAYAAIVLSATEHGIVSNFNSVYDAKGDATALSSNGVRASGVPFMAGMIRNGELTSGEIRHALVGGAPKSLIMEDYVWPGAAFDPDGEDITKRPSGCLEMGALLAIPPEVDIENIPGLSENGKVLARALQNYGWYCVDRGGAADAKPGISLQFDTQAWDMYEWLNGDGPEDDSRGELELALIMPYLQRVTNNTPESIGGGGDYPEALLLSKEWADDNGDTTAPTVPTDLAASATPGKHGVNLSWTASSDTVGVFRYYIYRDGLIVGSSDTNSFTDTTYYGNDLLPGAEHTWTVEAMDLNRNKSAKSAGVTYTMPGDSIEVLNGSFENSLGDWLTWPWQFDAVKPQAQSVEARSGKAVKFGTFSSGVQSVSQTVLAQPSSTYTISAWVKSSGSPLLLQAYDDSGNLATASTTETDWTELTIQVTTGPSQTSFGLRVIANPGSGGYADDISITREPPVLVSITAPEAVTDLENGAESTLLGLALPDKVTMVTNEGEEEAAVTWMLPGTDVYDPADTGAQSFTVSGTAALPAGISNENSVSLDVSIQVSVKAAEPDPNPNPNPVPNPTPSPEPDPEPALPDIRDKDGNALKPDEEGKLVIPEGATVITPSGIPLPLRPGEVTLDPEAPLGIVAPIPFEDVPQAAWYSQAVAFAYQLSLFDGKSEAAFAPQEAMTRVMLVTVLHNAMSKPQAKASGVFRDVPAGEYYSEAADWAAEMNIISGIGNDLFAPNDRLTREQLVVMLHRFAKTLGLEASAGPDSAFADSESISDWAKEAVDWARAAGIVNGKPGNLFDPKGPATRAEVATVLMNFFALAK